MKQSVVSNTGPIIALASVEKLHLLKAIFDHVAIPESVHKEILQGGSTDQGVAAYKDAEWIQVEKVSISPDPMLLGMLHAGEAEVILLAAERQVPWVLIDEVKARKIARNIYMLNIVGTARVLVEAKQRGLIDNVGNTLKQMRENGYWIGDRIVGYACNKVGEPEP